MVIFHSYVSLPEGIGKMMIRKWILRYPIFTQQSHLNPSNLIWIGPSSAYLPLLDATFSIKNGEVKYITWSHGIQCRSVLISSIIILYCCIIISINYIIYSNPISSYISLSFTTVVTCCNSQIALRCQLPRFLAHPPHDGRQHPIGPLHHGRSIICTIELVPERKPLDEKGWKRQILHARWACTKIHVQAVLPSGNLT